MARTQVLPWGRGKLRATGCQRCPKISLKGMLRITSYGSFQPKVTDIRCGFLTVNYKHEILGENLGRYCTRSRNIRPCVLSMCKCY